MDQPKSETTNSIGGPELEMVRTTGDNPAMPETGHDRSRIAASVAISLIAGAAFGLLAYCSIELTRGDGRVAAVWLPNAVALAFLLRAKVPYEPLLFAMLWSGNVAANLFVGDPFLQAAALSSANSLEILVAAKLIRRYCGNRPDVRRISDLGWFVVFAGGVAPMASACLALTVLGSGEASLIIAWLKWTVTDALGMIIIAPALLIFYDSFSQPRALEDRELAEGAILTLFGIAATYAIFQQSAYPLLFLVAPIVVIHAFRLGSFGTALAVTEVAVISTLMTWKGTGPISLIDSSMTSELIVLQAFLASAFFMGLPVAAVLNQERYAVSRLAERQAQLRLLANNITDAVLRYDTDGVCTYASPSVRDVLGEKSAAFLGIRASHRVHPEAKVAITQAEANLLSGASKKERFTYRRYLDDEDGEPVYIEADAAIAVNRTTREPEGIVVSARNVTHRVKLERDLKRARRHAENAAIAKSQFLANMSHEIRTPMNGVLGFAELLLQADLPEEQRRHAALIEESGTSMMRLLNDILDISKIEAGQMATVKEAVDLRHLAENCLRLHSANAEQKGISINLEVADGLPELIESDALRVRQIVLNLLGNAVKFTHNGEIDIKIMAEGDKVAVAVKDSGIGIEADRLEAIFHPFEQADNATSRKFGGTGLGLSISSNLARLLGGALDAHSAMGEGSTFTLRLPLVEPSAAVRTNGPASTSSDPADLVQGSKILLAEDHDINQILVTTMLERCGQSVEVAENGQLAVAAIMAAKASGTPFDLVLMDVQMPEIDGYLATQTVRNLGITAEELPIIALTANAFEDDIHAAQGAGMQDHLAKPLQFDRLVETLAKWLPSAAIPHEARQQVSASKPPPATSQPSSSGPSLQERWAERRGEALEAVSEALRKGHWTGEPAEELGRIVHKLAGTAGMFGEDELGRRASELDRALQSESSDTERSELAERLLRAA